MVETTSSASVPILDCPICGHSTHEFALCAQDGQGTSTCGCPINRSAAGVRLMEGIDPDAVLNWHRANMTLAQALVRLDRFIAIGASGWADPAGQAALEKVRAAAAASLPETSS